MPHRTDHQAPIREIGCTLWAPGEWSIIEAMANVGLEPRDRKATGPLYPNKRTSPPIPRMSRL